ncbi:pyridoxamine 5'-phosphate oxidase family protein, partial [Candidatus Saccharibacteria bacterium]|nr:pyridoxamine 5'-phosphate oxidase family protein [Candidatus Saccharibacteria bacterium]
MSANPTRAAEILRSIRYITLASVTPDNEPWNSPLYYVYDETLRLYWFSDKDGQHSQNVRTNPKVFIAIYDSTVAPGTGDGVYIQATVRELENDEEIVRAR